VSRAWGWQSADEAKANKDIVAVMERPEGSMPVPKGVHWDLFLGPAPERPFHDVYWPGPRWYRWRDFGSGTMSDMGSHLNDLPFWALKLTFKPIIYDLKLAGRRPEDYASLGLSPKTHIAMEFDHKKMINGLGNRVESPKLNGVSGGPVWSALRVDHPSGKPALMKLLAGIVIEHRKAKRTLVATRVAGVLDGIAHTFPELAQFIPQVQSWRSFAAKRHRKSGIE
jgi:hypothetical protein